VTEVVLARLPRPDAVELLVDDDVPDVQIARMFPAGVLTAFPARPDSALPDFR